MSSSFSALQSAYQWAQAYMYPNQLRELKERWGPQTQDSGQFETPAEQVVRLKREFPDLFPEEK